VPNFQIPLNNDYLMIDQNSDQITECKKTRSNFNSARRRKI
jgi:hypothetical protein